ncbi:hypothetical protein D8674_026184 [Pyrus ussuriensis x Pyrus communis]|uniref:Uncharacterized protein n=1 Tax=Pyrus ussuriensis x Pyrus communis TaxID=2448454 RepID=A0A5N5ID59_9ROSA|nr:hypothetical protein D8674_026184 [Pyrus ussuriensis x Pyrus communis]
MGNIFAVCKFILHGVMKLVGMRPQTVEIEPGIIMNFWPPVGFLKSRSLNDIWITSCVEGGGVTVFCKWILVSLRYMDKVIQSFASRFRLTEEEDHEVVIKENVEFRISQFLLVDRKMVLNGGPWTFEKMLLLLTLVWEGHCFGLGDEDVTMDFDDDIQPSNPASPVVSPVVSDLILVGTNLRVPGNLRDDHGQTLDSRTAITEDLDANRNFSHIYFSPNIPDFNIDINDAELEELDPISLIFRAHLHVVDPGFTDAVGNRVNLIVGPVGCTSVSTSHFQEGLDPIITGLHCEPNPDPFNLSPIIRQIMGSPSSISGNRRKRAG